ncbi:MAG: neutral/alkaline non-lysosomal ceramidase N-terminal domain-containing protein [Candidatus Hodarchaeota archaeon]
MLKAGFQEVVITSPIGSTALAGYGGLKQLAQGINDQLLANCAVIENENERVAIVSLDLVGILPETVQNMRELANTLTNGAIKKENILICCTHTHSGPDTIGIFYPGQFLRFKPDTDYLKLLERFVAGGILGAYNNLQEVEMKAGKDYLNDASSNRREGGLPPNPVSPRTIDPEVQLISFDVNKETVGLVVNFAAHATSFSTSSRMHMSADYVGALREEIKAKLGKKVVVVYLNGACGDISPRSSVLSSKTPELIVKIDASSKKVEVENFSGFCKANKIDPGQFDSFYNERLKKFKRSPFFNQECKISFKGSGDLMLEFKDGMPPAMGFKRMFIWFLYAGADEPAHVRVGKKIAKKALEIYKKRKKSTENPEVKCSLKTVRINIDDPEMANEGVFEEYMIKIDDRIYSDVEVQVIKIDDILILTMPGEPVNEIQLRLKALIRQQSHVDQVLFAEIANGQIGYILTPEEYDMMGYESIICFGRENAHILEKELITMASELLGKKMQWNTQVELSTVNVMPKMKLSETMKIERIN